ncbi:MAG: hypothetical protein ACYC4I_02315 [Minisyncoccota bacterium]
METIVSLLINGSLILFGVVVGHFVTKYTHASQKIYDRKSDLVIDLYKEVVRLEFALKRYIHFTGAEMGKDSINKKIEELNVIKNDFQSFQHKFWEVEIILEDSTADKINQFLQTYIVITSKLSVAHISQQIGDSERSFDKWNESFEAVSKDLVKIKNDLKEEFKRALKK